MFGIRTRFVVAVATATLALSACTAATKDGPTSTQNGSPTSTQTSTPTSTLKPSPTPSVPPDPGTKEALGDVTLGAIRVDSKLGTSSAEVTITNHSSKRSNYIVDLSITTADGKTQLAAAMVSAQGLAPGKTTKQAAHFNTTQTLPTGAKLTIVGVARLVA